MPYLTNGTAGLTWIRAFAYMCSNSVSIASCILPGQANGNGERGGQNAKEGSGRIAVDMVLKLYGGVPGGVGWGARHRIGIEVFVDLGVEACL